MDLRELKLDKPTTIVRLYNGDKYDDKGVYKLDYNQKIENALDLIMLGYRHSESSWLSFIDGCYEYFYGDNAMELAKSRLNELEGLNK